VDRTNRLERVRLVRALVLAISLHPGESEGNSARIARARLNAIEGDFDDELGAHLHHMLVPLGLELEQPVGLPREYLVGHPLEGLARTARLWKPLDKLGCHLPSEVVTFSRACLAARHMSTTREKRDCLALKREDARAGKRPVAASTRS